MLTSLYALLLSLSSHATSENQAWSRLRAEAQYNNYHLGLQLQHRHSFEERKLFEEQVNFDVGIALTEDIELTGLWTFGIENAYEKMREYRSAVQLEWNKTWGWLSHSLRARQEFRDFDGLREIAMRFRLRTEWIAKLNTTYSLSASFEPNFYINRVKGLHRGLSSHRSVFLLLLYPWRSVEME